MILLDNVPFNTDRMRYGQTGTGNKEVSRDSARLGCRFQCPQSIKRFIAYISVNQHKLRNIKHKQTFPGQIGKYIVFFRARYVYLGRKVSFCTAYIVCHNKSMVVLSDRDCIVGHYDGTVKIYRQNSGCEC